MSYIESINNIHFKNSLEFRAFQGHFNVAESRIEQTVHFNFELSARGYKLIYVYIHIESVYSKLIVFINSNQNDGFESQPSDCSIRLTMSSRLIASS